MLSRNLVYRTSCTAAAVLKGTLGPTRLNPSRVAIQVSRGFATPSPAASKVLVNPWNEKIRTSDLNDALKRWKAQAFNPESEVRVGVTWLTNEGGKLEEKALLENVNNIPASQSSKIRSIIVLVTPSQTHLINPHGFLGALVSRIYGELQWQSVDGAALEIRTIAAVVDALPSFSLGSTAGNPRQGISILLSSADMTGMSKPVVAVGDGDEYTLQFVTEVVSSDKRGNRLKAAHMTLPVANTVFVNGHRATLVEDVWQIYPKRLAEGSTVSSTAEHQQQRMLQSSTIPLCSRLDVPTRRTVPVRALTEPRRIRKAMGNVVAEIEVNKSALPASTELEKAVSEYLQQNPTAPDSGPLKIFALVRPQGSLKDKDRVERRLPLNSFPAHSRLFKVTGGGGGWGKKQGLLSLDPASDFTSHTEISSFPDIDSLDNTNVEVEMELKAMMPKKSTIKFLVFPFQPKEDIPVQYRRHELDLVKSFEQWSLCVIGTCLNTAEDTLGSEHNDSPVTYQCMPNRFGMFTFSGAAVGTEVALDGREFVTGARSRLDVPNSIISLPVNRRMNSWNEHKTWRQVRGISDQNATGA